MRALRRCLQQCVLMDNKYVDEIKNSTIKDKSKQERDIPLLQGYLPLKTNVVPLVYWWLQDCTRLLQVTTNILYHHAMSSISW